MATKALTHENFRLDVVRPDDLVVLRFRFQNFVLNEGRTTTTLQPQTGALIIVEFPHQAFAERAFSDTTRTSPPDPPPDTAPGQVAIRISRPGRLVFRIDPKQAVAYTLPGSWRPVRVPLEHWTPGRHHAVPRDTAPHGHGHRTALRPVPLAQPQGGLGRQRRANSSDRWCARASRSRMAAFVKVAKTMRQRPDMILNAVEHGISNGRVEGFNTKVRLLIAGPTASTPPTPLWLSSCSPPGRSNSGCLTNGRPRPQRDPHHRQESLKGLPRLLSCGWLGRASSFRDAGVGPGGFRRRRRCLGRRLLVLLVVTHELRLPTRQ